MRIVVPILCRRCIGFFFKLPHTQKAPDYQGLLLVAKTGLEPVSFGLLVKMLSNINHAIQSIVCISMYEVGLIANGCDNR